ncbi:hypothetical protein LGH83_08935 [Lichenihabitans sp. PAMC28606]|uniref:hypothetical protein n=1 Tax=Lichenihabitans sp. PAMC28606 TaxID=2880932 RepID=UPI001D0B6E91|nr:hypothetical protein [Lichenihabitans sp. PAMC28606]UDL96281.1 hypothetical protein LGH83_08935 [Lichenihabitans sp. PAMC28606]
MLKHTKPPRPQDRKQRQNGVTPKWKLPEIKPVAAKRKRQDDQILEVDWLAQQNPAMAIEEAQSAFAAFEAAEAGYHDRLARVLVRIIAIARYMDANYEAWREFTRHPLLQGLRQKPKDKAKVKAVAYVVEQADNETARARASKHARALSGLMLRGVKTDDALAVIKQDGIEALLREARELAPRAQPKRAPKPVVDDFHVIDDHQPVPVKQRRVTLEIEISEKLLAKALLSKGAKGRIVFRSLGACNGTEVRPEGWTFLVAEKVSRLIQRPKSS